MNRFFFEPNQQRDPDIELSREESRHAIKVLRLKKGDTIELFDGLGTAYLGLITSAGKKLQVNLQKVLFKEPEPEISLRVVQALLKGDKMDTLIQKCTELGVTEIAPFSTSRCQGKLNPQTASRKLERWKRIGIGACKQCSRIRPMRISLPVTLADIFNDVESFNQQPERAKELKILFWEEEKNTHIHDLPQISERESITLMLGPEGGFTEEEVALARSHGFQTVSLGRRILRAETATLTGVSIIQHLAGNL